MNLSATDVDLLLATIGELSAQGPLDQLRERTPILINRLVAADSTSWNEIDPGSGARVIVSYPDLTTDDLMEAFNAHIHEHPVIRHHDATGDGRPWMISDFVTREEFRESPLYQTVYRHIGVEDQVSFVLPDPDVLLGIASNGDWTAFDARDRMMLNLTRPYLVRARRDALAYDRTRWYLATVDDLLELDGEGLLLVDAHGRVDYLTPNAAHITNQWFGTTRAGKLPDTIADWLSSDRANEPLQIEAPDRRLRARCLPGPDDFTKAVLLRESGLNANSRARLIRLGLTDREAEILHLAVDGRSNAHIAQQLHISHRTVEQHVHAALNKLGATNRTQAARLLREH
jgi:DNA-binding CsgD family transcriptional regulator